jgi:hypothetical protein
VTALEHCDSTSRALTNVFYYRKKLMEQLEGGVAAIPGMVVHSNSSTVMSNPYRQKTNRALSVYSFAVTVGCLVLFVAFGKQARDAAQLDNFANRLIDLKMPPQDVEYTVEVDPRGNGSLNKWLSTKTNSTAICYVSASVASCRNADFKGSIRFGEDHHQGRQLLVPNQQHPNED